MKKLIVFFFSVVLLGSCKKYPEGSLISLSSPEKRIKRNWSLNQDSIRRFIFQEENILKYYSSQNILSELYWKFYDKKRKLILSVNDDFTLHNDTLIIINLSNKNLCMQHIAYSDSMYPPYYFNNCFESN
tara:strand:+ start:54 stop:443 length:390 start_codon:yes stop_codon:yes gene_type:complete